MAQIIPNVDAKVTRCEAIINHTFTNKALLLEALNAAGSSGISIRYSNSSYTLAKNDAMAIVGDAQVEAIMASIWWKHGTRNLGHWTDIRRDNLSNKSGLAPVGRTWGLHACIIVNPGNTTASDGTIATTMEAILGAVFLDAGRDELERVMRHLGICNHAHLA
jgi:ribonuclease-3